MTDWSGISTADRDLYHRNGFHLQRSVFSEQELDALRHAAALELAIDTPRRTLDTATGVAYGRTDHTCTTRCSPNWCGRRAWCALRTRLPVDDVYVHQFKINTKAPFNGGTWGWHQGFTFCNIPRASGQNMSGRSLILIRYNAIHNALPAFSPRPEWLIGRDFASLVPAEDGLLDTTGLVPAKEIGT